MEVGQGLGSEPWYVLGNRHEYLCEPTNLSGVPLDDPSRDDDARCAETGEEDDG